MANPIKDSRSKLSQELTDHWFNSRSFEKYESTDRSARADTISSYVVIVDPHYKHSPKISLDPASSLRKRNLQDDSTNIFSAILAEWHDVPRDSRKSKEIFTQNLLLSFERQPLEDGFLHPTESIIGDALKIYKNVPQWIENLYDNHVSTNPTISASLLLSVSRLKVEVISPWGYKIAAKALKEKDIEVRESAVRALESWGGNNGLELLKTFVDSESVNWLKIYTEKIIEELSE